jgi:hypothetical protein
MKEENNEGITRVNKEVNAQIGGCGKFSKRGIKVGIRITALSKHVHKN